jgi:CRP-like cAMP-binding protein
MQMKQDASAFLANPELIATLQKRSIPLSLGPERILFRQGELPTGIFIVTKGAAILTMQSGKLIAMRARAEAGSILGLPGVLGDAPYSLTARALEGAEVDFLPKEEFHCLLRVEPLLSLKVLPVLAAEVRVARQALAGFPWNSALPQR